jgi:uncharacterized membrane protein
VGKPLKGIEMTRHLKTALVLGMLSLTLAGCVVYPGGGYRYGYAPGYYAAPVVAPVIVGGWGWGGGWGRWR